MDHDMTRDASNGHHADQAPPPLPYRGSGRRPRWHGYTAFVLSGGGARGALQVGALRALIERGIRPDVLVGTSIGAWNAAVLAREPGPAGVARLVEIWRSLSPTLVMLGREAPRQSPPQAVAGMLMLAAARRVAGGAPSLYGDAGARLLAERHLKDATFEAMRLPLRIVAANITSGGREVFASGPVAPAVIASSAIPGVFPPVRIGDQVYVDGGAVDNLSLDVALALGARRLFVLDVGYDANARDATFWLDAMGLNGGRPHSGAHALAALLERTIQVMSRYHADRDLAAVPPGIETHLLRLTTGASEGALAFGNADAWIEAGYEAATAYLDATAPALAHAAEAGAPAYATAEVQA